MKDRVFFLILLLAFGLCLGVSDRPIWFDEACTYWEARDVPTVRAMASISPLPALIVKPFIGRWSEPWMLRLPFILIGLVSLLLFMQAIREWYDLGTARATGFLLALSPFHVYYSSEARMYAAVLLSASLTFLFLVRLLPWQTDLTLAQCDGTIVEPPSPFSIRVAISDPEVDNVIATVSCGRCGHQWQDGMRYKDRSVVRCPRCRAYNRVDTSRF